MERDLVRTGIEGLDAILDGGIPRQNVVLLAGAIGTGKTTLGVEFIYRGISMFDEPGIIVLFEVSPAKLIRDAAGFGWDLPALEADGRLRIIFTTRPVFRQELQQADGLLLEQAVKMGARRIFVDGVAGLGGDTSEPREAFHVLVEGLQREDLTPMLALEAAAPEPGVPSSPEEGIADTVIRLRLEDIKRSTLRSLQIVKSRGHDYGMGRHSFRIVEGKGIEAYRRVQAPRRDKRERAAAFDTSKRITTGVPGLDEIVNGGYYVGSTTVVAGISGVGKSVMALQYIAEGIRRGERSLMLSLDEQASQITRNASTIGIDLGPAIEQGLVRIHYDPPQEIEIDHHFRQIERIMEEFKPVRVVFDSLSTYGSSLGPPGRVFRDFFHALIALMKEHQVGAVYNHENPEMLGMSSMMGEFAMSSLVDNILLLNWVELGDQFRLALTVAKMRANPTSRVTHEVEILDGKGMRVLPRRLTVAEARRLAPFAAYSGLVSRAPTRLPDAPPDALPADDED